MSQEIRSGSKEQSLPIRVNVPGVVTAGIIGVDAIRNFCNGNLRRTALEGVAAVGIGYLSIDARKKRHIYQRPEDDFGLKEQALAVVAFGWLMLEDPSAGAEFIHNGVSAGAAFLRRKLTSL